FEAGCGDPDVCDCISNFNPEGNKRYLLSFWLASDESLTFGDEISTGQNQWQNNFHFSFRFANASGNFGSWNTFFPDDGPIIDGWQRIQADIVVPAGTSLVRISASPPGNLVTDTDYYIDDVRIQPFESIMTTYVYDPGTLRLMAELDENNYATFYEYDDEGQLIRVKRETDRGIMTVSEQHNNLGVTNNQ
ncbi:MAG: hypothetical protein AAFR97_09720, partial [Bacteroidota bacterium]